MNLDPKVLKDLYGDQEPMVNPFPEARKYNPDDVAQGVAIQKRTGVDAILAAQRLPEFQSELDQDYWNKLVKDSPKTAKFMAASPVNAALMQPDADSGALTAIADAAKWLVSAPSAKRGMLQDAGTAATILTVGGSAGLGKIVFDTFGMGADLLGSATGSEQLKNMGATWRGQGTRAGEAIQNLVPKEGWWDSSTGKAVGGGLASAGTNIMMLPLGLERAAAGAVSSGASMVAGLMGVGAGADAYSDARNKEKTALASLLYAVPQGAFEYAFEKMPAGKLFADLAAGKSTVKSMINQVWPELWTEQMTTVAQDFNTWMNLNPEKTLSQFIAERPEAAYQTLVATLIGVGAQSGSVRLMSKAFGADESFKKQAEQAEQHAAVLEGMQTTMQASKLLERSPETLTAYAQSLAEDGAPEIFVDPVKLKEAGVDLMELAQAMPSVAAQLENLQVGGDLIIPTGELLTSSIGATFAQPLIDNARTDVNGMSRVEAKEYMAEKGDKINSEIERVLQEKQQDTEFKAGRDEVQGQILQQLNGIKRFTPKVNEQYAALAANFYAVMAARTGMTVQDFSKTYKLGFDANTAQGSQVMDQPGSLGFDNWFSDSKVVDAEGKPMVVYHGTAGDFDTFKRSRSDVGMHFGTKGQADDRLEYQRDRGVKTPDGMNIMPVYLKIENPLRLPDLGGWDSDTMDYALRDLFPQDANIIRGLKTPKQILDYLTRKGYDGIVYKNTGEVDGSQPYRDAIRAAEEGKNTVFPKGKNSFSAEDQQVPEYQAWSKARRDYQDFREANGVDSYIVFNPTQIKSAIGNNGNFDPKDANILNQDQQAAEEPSDDSAAQISQGEVPTSVDEVAGLGSTLKLAASKVWQKGRDLKLAMQEAVQSAASAAGVDVSAPSPQSRDYLIRVGVKDALVALEQNANAVGWYDLKTRQALAVMALVHPEIATDERARVAFVWAMAVTSNGLKVGKNFEIAEKVYRGWKASAKEVPDRTMPTNVGIGTAAGAINDSLELYNTLSKEWGPEELRKFMLSDFTVGQITGISKDLKPGGEHAATTVKGAAILGPKIGNGFFSNLYGNFSSLTMDRWLVRTWGRWTGTLIKPMPVQTQKAKDRLGAVLANIAKDPAELDRLSKAIGVEIAPDMSLDALATAVQEASMDPPTREVMNQTGTGLELRKAGNSLAKYLDGQKEAPAGPTERNYIRDVFGGMLSELRNDPRYSDLTMADLQAVLWYAEKRLYESAKEDPNDDEVEGYSDDEAPDYANAAAEVARQSGITQRRIDNVLKKEAENGRTTDAGSPTTEGGKTGVGEQGPAAGFTRSEKREFIARRAIHRVRSNRERNASEPWTYAGARRGDGQKPGLLKKLGVSYVAEWKLGQKAATVFKANGLKYPKFLELAPGDTDNAQKFADAITASKVRAGRDGAAVYVYPTEDYAVMRLFLSEDGGSGVAIKADGDIVSVFGGGGTGHATMELAVAAGGLKLDAFETILPQFYSAHGFVPVSRLTWDDSQSPDGWDKEAFAPFNNGEPDVVFMALDPQFYGNYDHKQGTRMDGENGYDKALAAQKRAMNKVKKGQTLNQDARGQIAFGNDITQQASIISLLKDADLSTFIHESGHFFLEVQADLARRISTRIAQGDVVTDGEKSIMDDFNTTLKWMGIEGDENITPIDKWSMMTADEKRPSHELFARGFEAYAFEGKAPSLDLQSTFQTFRAWLVNVYRTIKDKLIGDTLNVQLNDEVRAVMDRMLATTEAIEEAEAARAMGPLFKTPEEGGMDLEAYKAYHDMGVQASQDAIQELQAKGLRDMQWLQNARSRKLKELQKQHDALRAQIAREVRGEVMREPIYQVWAFLTSKTGDQAVAGVTDLENSDLSTASGKLRTQVLRDMYGTEDDAVWRKLSAQRMTSDEAGLHPDLVAETFGFQSGDQLVKALALADPPKQIIDELTDQRMLQEHGDLATPAGLERAADAAIHNDARVKFVATELRALQHAMTVREKVPGQKNTVDVLARAAKDHATALISRLKVRDVRPAQYAAAEARAAKAAEKARGDIEKQTEAKRNQLINLWATKAAYAAQDEVQDAVEYFKKFNTVSKTLDPEYQSQIHALLERFDLRQSTSLSTIDKRKSLVEWVADQVEDGMEPDIPPELLQEANRKHFKDMTVEEVRGLRDTIKQIEHLGRLKSKLLTAKEQREFAKAVGEITGGIEDNANGRTANDTRTPNTLPALALQSMNNFWASHIKAATWARVMDGGKDGGKVWEYLIRTANDAGNTEVVMREKATKELAKLVAPVLKQGKMGGKGEFFPSINRSLNREAVLAIALNVGNASNMQRLLGGEGWTREQLGPVLATLSAADWSFVQSVWDHFESYRPQIAAKETRVYGKEPKWIEATPLAVKSSDGASMMLRGGYYPVKFDPRASGRAEMHADAEAAKAQLKGAYTSATTRRSFTKTRVEEVNGRPLLYSLDGIYNGVQEVIHDLTWHEWLIDANKILKNKAVDQAIRNTYGPDVVRQFKDWIADNAEGGRGAQGAGEMAAAWVRQGVSVSGLGLNVMSALMQPLGLTQSIVRIGPQWVARGISKAIGSPLETADAINEKSEFMRTRALTRLREIAEIRSQVKGRTAVREAVDSSAYFLMMRAQQLVDIPTWWGAYEKAISEGNNEDRAVALSDQAVIDAQGSGGTKDQSAIERGGPLQKLFTVFYSFFNTALNLGVGQTMTHQNKAKLAADYLLLFTVPALLGAALKDAFTAGDSGDWEDPEKLLKRLAGEQISFLMGLMVGVREMAGAVQAVTGTSQYGMDYSGPAGTRFLADLVKLGKQINQGEMDDGLRKAIVNTTGELLRLPSAQINRTITGAQALSDGKTTNPGVLLTGYQEPH